MVHLTVGILHGISSFAEQSENLFLYVYLHWVRGWISSRHSRRSRSRAVWGCPRSRGTSRPSTAPPATPGSTARTSATHKNTVTNFLLDVVRQKGKSCFKQKQWRHFQRPPFQDNLRMRRFVHLSVRQLSLVRQVVMHPVVHVVEDQHLRPGVL